MPKHRNLPVIFVFALVLFDKWNIACKCSLYLNPCPANSKLDAVFYGLFYNVDGVYQGESVIPDHVAHT